MASPFISSEYESETPPPPLAPPPLGGEYETVAKLLTAVNDITKLAGFAVVTRDSQKSPGGLKNKVYLRCTRGGKARASTSTGKRPGSGSQRIDCPFLAIAVLTIGGKWTLEKVENSNHNHVGAGEGSFAVNRRAFKRLEILADIRDQHYANERPHQILVFLRNKYKISPENPILKIQDIYNELSKIRAKKLSNLTPMQALNVTLTNDPDWFAKVKKNEITNEVKYLFLINKAGMAMLKANSKVLILDCTYKTNRYRMPLAILTGVMALNTSFYAGMCFLKGEKPEDYKWLIRTIKKLYQELNIPLPITWLSDGDPNIPETIEAEISSKAVHLLCAWHIENNVATNCKKHFSGQPNELWVEFFGNKQAKPVKIRGEFQRLIDAIKEDDFDLA